MRGLAEATVTVDELELNSIELEGMYEDVPGLYSAPWDFIGSDFVDLMTDPTLCSSFTEGVQWSVLSAADEDDNDYDSMPDLQTVSDSTEPENYAPGCREDDQWSEDSCPFQLLMMASVYDLWRSKTR